jgi:archaellum component FlaC
MLDILLGQNYNSIETVIYSIIGAGGISSLVVGILSKLLYRDVKKVLDHVENDKCHVREANGYISEEGCKRNIETVKKDISKLETKIDQSTKDHKDTHKRIDQLINQQNEANQKILLAITNIHSS